MARTGKNSTPDRTPRSLLPKIQKFLRTKESIFSAQERIERFLGIQTTGSFWFKGSIQHDWNAGRITRMLDQLIEARICPR
jgi:nitric oxide reductase large subunit